MKKVGFLLLVIFHFGLWSVFILNQFGIGPVWAAKEKEAQEVKKSSAPGITEVEKPTTTKTTKAKQKKEEKKLKRPKGMSDEEWEKMKAKKVLPYDKGPSTINVTKYPKEMQDIYKNVFKKKCSKCHTIARAINAPYALPGEWKKYIKKMMKKPGSGINPIAGKKIYKFMVYDSTIRKKEIIVKKLKEKERKRIAEEKTGKKTRKKKKK